MITIIRYFFWFVFLMVLQIFLFDYIFIFQYTRPVIFFFFLLFVPRISSLNLMLLAFATGFFYDIFFTMPGINTAACVLIAFIRDPLLSFFKKEEEGETPSVHISYLGFLPYLYYVVLISFIFHLCVTFLAVFSFSDFENTLMRAGLGTVLSVILIYLFDIVFFYRKADL